MTKSELIEAIASNQPHLAYRDVELSVKAMLEQMSRALANGERIEIRGFGSFSLHFRPPRMGRNPVSRVVIIDDHCGFRDRLETFVREQKGCSVAGIAGDTLTGLRLVHGTHPDVVLIDVDLPEESGLQFATRLAKLDAGDFDALVLAVSGLQRLAMDERVSEALAPEVT